MDTAEAGMPLVMKGPTYPFELFSDAKTLRDQARASEARDHRNIPGPAERAFSRAAIFTAFNFLESLLIDLAQDYVTNGPGAGTAYGQAMLHDLTHGNASISRTIKDWPINLVGKDVHGSHHFREFSVIRSLRNQLIHAKLEPLNPNELDQNQLLRRANCDEAAWVFGQICIMAAALYVAFGQKPLPEVQAEAAAAPRTRPAQL
jgi:hypothetical protein